MTQPKHTELDTEQNTAIKERALAKLQKKAADSQLALRFHRKELQVEQAAEMIENIQNAATREVEFGRLDQESQQLSMVRQAIEAVHLGTYGECSDCGQAIHARRLEALPWAIRCVQCQEQFELRAEPASDVSAGGWNLQATAA